LLPSSCAGGDELVDDTGHQRTFRSNQRECDAFGFDQVEQRIEIGRLDVDVATLGLARGAGVARRNQHFMHAWRLRELPGERVFAAAGADDQKFHREVPAFVGALMSAASSRI
jgi:hypothetical protein